MKFSEIIKQTSELLRQRGRLSYRTLRMEFDLEEEQLDVLKEQLLDIEALAVDQDGKMLVWVGNSEEDKGRNGEQGSKEETAKRQLPVLNCQLPVPNPSLLTASPQPPNVAN